MTAFITTAGVVRLKYLLVADFRLLLADTAQCWEGLDA
jgi:hypothetical protein